MSELKLVASSSPHAHSDLNTQKIMRNVIIALMPASVVGVIVYGFRALLILLISTASSVLVEFLIEKIMKKPVTIGDLSAAVTGLLIGLNMPINVPLWIPVIGSFIAIALVKQLYGGIGHNFVNPALAARVILMISWAAHMSGSAFVPLVDTVTTATPLAAENPPALLAMFLGMPGVYGCIGEISALALIIGGIYLVATKVISVRIPGVYILTVAVFSLLAGKGFEGMLFQLCAGGLMLGSIYMATDYTTSPSTPLGQTIYAVGCGIITCVIRFYGAYDEGVSFAILFMNVVTPLLDKYIKIKKFGEVKSK